MTHYLAELYSPKPAWLTLHPKDRQRFFETIGAGMAGLSAIGVEALAFGETDGAIVHAPSQRFFAIWRAPDAAAIQALAEGITASGWHDYFETINAAGAAGSIDEHLAQLAGL